MRHADPLTPSLFDDAPPPVPASYAETRRKARKRAFEKADKVFLEKYERCLITFGQVCPTFVAAEITERFEKSHGPMAEHQAKALGQLYANLQRRGVIEKTGKARPRKNGNAAF